MLIYWGPAPYRQHTGVQRRTASVSFRNVNVHAVRPAVDSRTDFNKPVLVGIADWKRKSRAVVREPTCKFDGFVKSGELLVVLGQSRSSEHYGPQASPSPSELTFYISPGYCGSVPSRSFRFYVDTRTDVNFPHVTVGQTLLFAAKVSSLHPPRATPTARTSAASSPPLWA
ncbi:hypothetical protein C8R47DRAFT_1218731 [Mycena vitilis]|nr:hypothetical protein C8R47DRAFT_1218731 [Mycena vitilis]